MTSGKKCHRTNSKQGGGVEKGTIRPGKGPK